MAETTTPVAKAAQAMPEFNIFEYEVDGNSVLDDGLIEQTIAPFLGEGKTLRDVENARGALEKAYHKAGYLTVVVSIPEQNVDAGAVMLHVVEAGVDRLKVKGAEYALPSAIKERLPELAEGKVPNFNTLQTQLAALNRGADIKATPILRAGRLPGTVEVQLDVEDQLPLHGSVDFSNRQAPNTTAQRLTAALHYDNLWQRGGMFAVNVQTTPQKPSESRMLAVSYGMPLNQEGAALALFAMHSRSDYAELANAPGLGLLGNSDYLGVRLVMPLAGAEGDTHSISLGADYKNVKQTLVVAGEAAPATPIAYVPLVASFNGNWVGENRSTKLDAATTFGWRGLLGNKEEAFAANRSGASAKYMTLRTGLAHTETLARWELYGKLDIQLASGPLVSTEQFGAGGAETVRGYLESERAGDAGVRATLELRTPQFSPAGAGSPWRLWGLAFLDAARLVTQQAVAPQESVHQLRGTGVGLRMNAPRGFSLEVDIARALVEGSTTHAGDTRVHARTLWGF